MIVLGNRYKFNKFDNKRLSKVFNKLFYIKYKNHSSLSVIKKIEQILTTTNTNLIVLNTKEILPLDLIEYLSKLEDKGIRYIKIEEFLEIYLQKCLFHYNQVPKEELSKKIKSYNFFQYIQKRLIDYIGIVFLFFPTIIAIIYSKIRIYKESPGPVLYKQLRVGKNEKEFLCIKIRSMHLDAEKNGAMFALKNDQRAFKWGVSLRNSKIDELTQIWNVLKGEMHLVGPRPERQIWIKEFEKSIPYYTQRHLVAPGITGLAQIKYQYGAGKLDAKQKLMYDLYYIKNWSIKLELEIIYQTILFLLSKNNFLLKISKYFKFNYRKNIDISIRNFETI